jgi:hypothetical protein
MVRLYVSRYALLKAYTSSTTKKQLRGGLRNRRSIRQTKISFIAVSSVETEVQNKFCVVYSGPFIIEK